MRIFARKILTDVKKEAMSKRFKKPPIFPRASRFSPIVSKIKIDLQNAFALHQRGRLFEAEMIYRNIVKTVPGDFEATHLLGVVLFQRGQVVEADQLIARALKINPNDLQALNNRGNVLLNLERFEEALTSYDRALSLRPDYAVALNGRGSALFKLKRFEEALTSYDRALSLRPDYAEALKNRGDALFEIKQFEEALASFDHAIRLQPDYADAHLNEALCRMLIGDFDRGWEKYEWRWGNTLLASAKRNFVQPLWLGSGDISGKTILLHAEQGFGDTIQFCRYVPLVAARGARIILEVQEPLHELLNSLIGAIQIVSKDAPLPDFDMHCPLLSLPLAFRTRLETIPSTTPYLYAPSQALKKWDTRLGPQRHPRIGLVWSGALLNRRDSDRSIGLRKLLPLLSIDATFVSLQKEIRPDDATLLNKQKNILHFGADLENFSDTAALISHLDLVISVETSVAHVAGALGKPTWVLLPFIPAWRWLLDREDSPWYPTARLFRQPVRDDWMSVVAKVEQELRSFAGHRRSD
jgi:Flp pilus assembly protein TadD